MRVSRVTRVKPVYMRLPGFCQSVFRVSCVSEARRALCASPRKAPFVPCKSAFSDFKVFFQTALRPRRGRATSYSPTAARRAGLTIWQKEV